MATSNPAPRTLASPRKILLYFMPDNSSGHAFLSIRGTTKNRKGRWVTGRELRKYGLIWKPGHYVVGDPATTRDELALILGRALLDEANI
jgi:hypothetical protein